MTTELNSKHPNKGNFVRNADVNDLLRMYSVRYGKHSIRYLGPHLWSRLLATDKKRLTIDNFRNSITDTDLTIPM